jgi:4-alpha-glucanotransferase
MDKQAGAPPDDFAVKGQNWGFPTYNWQQMQQDGFQWWKKRFAQMSHYFDAFRIDHILGFFRIWSIPMDAVEGILGYFVPALPVDVSELERNGITLNKERFTRPFINDSILTSLFANEAETVKATFLQKDEQGNYKLLPDFDTQRKVEAYFETQEATVLNNSTKQGLYDLISNVLLFETEPGANKFHCRIGLEKTTSFLYLDQRTQEALRAIAIDYFYRRQDDFWEEEAMRKLPELKRSTNMLICGEDLGMVPDCVPGVMKNLGILSLEIQRMPKDPTKEFFHPNDAPYLSVVTPSTHDMSTIRGWWEEDRKLTQHFYNTQLAKWGDAPYFCEPYICHDILLQHMYSPAMWSIFQLQDLMSFSGELRRENPHEERINIPADPKHYWRYRMHLTLEDLLKEKDFNKELHGYVTRSGR